MLSPIINNRPTTLPGLLESDMIEIRDVLQEDIRLENVLLFLITSFHFVDIDNSIDYLRLAIE